MLNKWKRFSKRVMKLTHLKIKIFKKKNMPMQILYSASAIIEVLLKFFFNKQNYLLDSRLAMINEEEDAINEENVSNAERQSFFRNTNHKLSIEDSKKLSLTPSERM